MALSEGAALRAAAHLLPESWRELVEVIDPPIPAASTETIAAPDDEALERLEAVEHIVVLMLESGASL
ncbi:MAG: hypothetical protein ACLQBB_03155 [Solirubrobacteraceae bacterium]